MSFYKSAQDCYNYNAKGTWVSSGGSEAWSFNRASPAESQQRQIAVTKASMSSTYGAYSASNCIDGNLKGARTFCHSRSGESWLKLDLGFEQVVEHLVIYNRIDCCQNRLGKHVIETSNDDSAWTTCFSGTLPSSSGPFTEKCSATARYVRVRMVGHSDSLNLQEVSVFGGKPSCGGLAIAKYNRTRGSFVAILPPIPSKSYPSALSGTDVYNFSVRNPTSKKTTVQLEFFRSNQPNAYGIAPMLLLPNGKPSGLPLQVSKRTASQSWLSMSTMFDIPANSNASLVLKMAYAQWGGLPSVSHAQVSKTGMGNGLWHESTLGSFGASSVTYQPNGQSFRSTITQIRPESVCSQSSTVGSCKKYGATEDVGGGDFMVYFNGTGSFQYLKQVRSSYPGGVGPCLSNVSYSGISADGAISQEVEVAI